MNLHRDGVGACQMDLELVLDCNVHGQCPYVRDKFLVCRILTSPSPPVNIFSKFQLPSSFGWYKQCVEDSELKNDSINPLLNDQGVFKT